MSDPDVPTAAAAPPPEIPSLDPPPVPGLDDLDPGAMGESAPVDDPEPQLTPEEQREEIKSSLLKQLQEKHPEIGPILL